MEIKDKKITILTQTLVAFFFVLGVLIFLSNANLQLFYTINSISAYTGGGIWQWLTILGDGFLTAVLLLFFINRQPRIVWSFVIATAVYMIILHALKQGLNIRRPPGVLDLNSFNLLGPSHSHHSFPSGHTTTIFTLIQIIVLHQKSIFNKLLLILGAFVIAISRIAIGVHWPLDICAGAILGLLAGSAGVYFAKKSKWGYSKIAQFILYLILVPGSIYMLFFYRTGYQKAHIFMLLLGTLALIYWMVDLFFYHNIFKLKQSIKVSLPQTYFEFLK